MTTLELEAQALALELDLLSFDELGMPYTPASSVVLNTVMPDSMGYEPMQRCKGSRRPLVVISTSMFG